MNRNIAKNYIVDHMFMMNGPGAERDKAERISRAIGDILAVTRSNLYATDCLVTWAKSMGFLEDPRFIESVRDRLTGDKAHDLVIEGTIWRKHIVLWAAHHCLGLDGDFAELGCYEGDTARMVVDYTNFGTTPKTYWLYDVFDNDGTTSEKRPAHSNSLYASTVAKFDGVRNIKIVNGFLPKSFADGVPDKIAFLHIDLNNAAAERSVLEILYPRVVQSGIIIFDDYGWVQDRPQKDTIDAFLMPLNKKVLEIPTGQGLLIK